MNTEHGEGIASEMVKSEWCGGSEKLRMHPTGHPQQLLPWPWIGCGAPYNAEETMDMQKH